MNIEQIKNALNEWNAVKRDVFFLTQLFEQGRGFDLYINYSKSELELAESIHAYPGIVNGELTFFTLLNNRDSKEQFESKEGILPYIKISTVSNEVIDLTETNENSILPDQEAIERINNWKYNSIEWIMQNVSFEDGIYDAFVIPIADLVPDDTHTAFFALVKPQIEDLNFKADLIIYNVEKNVLANSLINHSYFDTVRPVPPFGGGSPLDAFFLYNFSSIVNEFSKFN